MCSHRLAVSTTEGLRVIYLAVNSQEPGAATVTANDGKPLPKNPLLDVKVKQALSIAINREGLADRIMQKTARPTGQWLPPGTYFWATEQRLIDQGAVERVRGPVRELIIPSPE